MKVQLKLSLYIEGISERTLTVTQPQFIIGRLPECDLCLPFSEISRNHARIFYDATQQQWLVEDLSSTNGTLLNQFRVKAPEVLANLDVIQISNIFIGVTFLYSWLNCQNFPGITEARLILRQAEDLKEQWLAAETIADNLTNQERTIVRLKYLVEIAKDLNSAQSIETIFERVRAVLFTEIESIQDLALLVDLSQSGKLSLLKAVAKNKSYGQTLIRDMSWINQSICQRVFWEKVAIKCVDAPRDQSFARINPLLATKIRGTLAVPLWDCSGVVGVLYANAHLSLQDAEPLADRDLSFLATIANLAASSVQRWLLNYQWQREVNIRQKLERYYSPAVVKQLVIGQALQDGSFSPTEAEISILFADLVGFTTLLATLTPKQLTQLLNPLFEEMLQALFQSGGNLDKFTGDCIIAFFGTSKFETDHADKAVAAALEMLNRLDELNKEKLWPTPLQLRIAINSGKTMLGNLGSNQKADYTVLGPTVNLAYRMGKICNSGECLITEDTYRLLKYRQVFVKVGLGHFQGIKQTVKVYQTKRQQ